MSVLVLGGYGAVGGRIVDSLRERGFDAVAAGRDRSRADVVLDLGVGGAFGRALDDVDLVVNASGSEDVTLAETAAEKSIPFVDISATAQYCRALESVAGPVLIGAGIAPGLSGVLARELFSSTSTRLDVAIGLGAGEKHGVAATEWTYGLLGQTFVDPDGTVVKNFTGGRSIEFPEASGYRAWRSLRADFADQHRLTIELGIPVRTYLRLDSRLMTFGLGALTRIPWAHSLTPSAMPGGDRWAIVAEDGDGRSVWLTGRNQSSATADVAAWSAARILDGAIVVDSPVWLHSVVTMDDVSGVVNGMEEGRSGSVEVTRG